MKKNTINLACLVFFAIYFLYVIFFFYFEDDFLYYYSGMDEKFKRPDYSVSIDYFNDYKKLIPLREKLNLIFIFSSIFFLIINIIILKKTKSNYIIGIMICFIVFAILMLGISFLGILFYNSSPMIG